PFNSIGAPGAGNLISGNSSSGVEITGLASSNNIVLANHVGTDASGTLSRPNGASGVLITSSARVNTVGGTSVGEGNVIAFNTGHGIAVNAAANTNNVLRGNSIFSNGDLGIDLGTSGVTVNDAGDVDAGANQQQNFPVLTAFTNTSVGVIISGSLSS